MGDVLHYLIDGTSGIATGGVDGKALVAGVCSRGTVGKAYLIGKRTDLGSMLGTGPLVDRIRDMLVTGGQEPYVVAVPVQGQPGGYISALTVTEGKTGATVFCGLIQLYNKFVYLVGFCLCEIKLRNFFSRFTFSESKFFLCSC